MAAKRVIILGSTGSIGRATIEVARGLGGAVEVVGLAAGANWERLAEQASELRPKSIAICEESSFDELRRAVGGQTRVFAGAAGLIDLIAETEADFVVSAIVGAAGLPPTLAAVERGIDVGLANKESLVVAGAILMPLAKKTGSNLIPVDSEHSAVFQAMHAGRRDEVKTIYLTASGGPFRTWAKEKIAAATVEQALKHPNWVMGPKITIDSATMMNKALEIIEAHHLFDAPPEMIEVLVHPESIVHSMVEYQDGSVLAQLGVPDMKTPIQYALTYPLRAPGASAPLDWRQVRTLNFEPPDMEKFPALRLGFEAARAGGSLGAVLNAANEAAVAKFRAGAIRFGEIAELTETTMQRHRRIDAPTLEQLLEADAWARHEVMECR